MSNYYNLDGIKTELNKRIATEEFYLTKWEAVTFPTKKDGTPFANMGKNFEGASYHTISYAMQPGENVLSVGGWCDGVGYVSNDLDCYALVKYLKDETMCAKTQNYMPKQSYLEQVYRYDVEDIKKAVANRIEYLKKRIESLKAQRDIVESCFNDYRAKYAKALEELETACMAAGNAGYSGNRNDIYYMILDTVKEKFPYC